MGRSAPKRDDHWIEFLLALCRQRCKLIMRIALGPRLTRLVLLATSALLLLLAVGAIIARANMVSDIEARRGEGPGLPSGYLLGGFEYALEPADPKYIDSVTFTLASVSGALAPRQVRLSGDGGAHWATCTPLRGSGWTCPIHVLLRDLTSLRVVAAQ